MKNWNPTLKSLGDLAAAVAPLIPGGEQMVKLGQEVVKVIDAVQAQFADRDDGAGDIETTEQVMKLIEQRRAIEAAVNEHVDRTVADLRGKS